MGWLIAYVVGVIVMLAIVGWAMDEQPTPDHLRGALVAAILWPLVLPLLLGFSMRGGC